MIKNTIILFGDSGNAFNSSINSTFGSAGTAPSGNAFECMEGLFNVWNQSLGFPFVVVSMTGVVGDTTTQMLARYATDCLGTPSDHVFFWSPGSNDTPSTSGISAATSISNLTTMFDAILADGRTLWVPTIPPRGGQDATSIAHAMAINAFLYTYEAAHDNFNTCDIFPYTESATLTSFVTAGTPTQPAASNPDTVDGFHYSCLGASKANVGLLQAWNGKTPAIVQPQDIRGCISANPFMEGSASVSASGISGAIPPGYWYDRSGAIAATASVVARSDAATDFPGLFDASARGQLTKLALSGSTSNSDKFSLIFYPLAGSVPNLSGPWQLCARVGVKVTSGTLRECYLQGLFYTSSGGFEIDTNLSGYPGYVTDSLNSTHYGVTMRSRPFYLPNNLTSMQINAATVLSSGGAATVWWGDCYLRKYG